MHIFEDLGKEFHPFVLNKKCAKMVQTNESINHKVHNIENA